MFIISAYSVEPSFKGKQVTLSSEFMVDCLYIVLVMLPMDSSDRMSSLHVMISKHTQRTMHSHKHEMPEFGYVQMAMFK